MADITSLDDLPVTVTTTAAHIRKLIAEIDITIRNLIAGDGKYGAMDIVEGDHQSNPTRLLAELRQQRKAYVDQLKDDVSLGDFGIAVSEWDNPDLPLGGYDGSLQ